MRLEAHLVVLISAGIVIAGDAAQLRGPSGTSAGGHSIITYVSQSFYHMSLVPLIIITFSLARSATPSTVEVIPRGFKRFQVNFLVAWCFCVAADWFQGAYIYALYEAYGYNRHQIAYLFIADYGASLICGCFVGSFADIFGRKKMCEAYCLLYILSCLIIHVNIYPFLMLGRIIGGIAMSIQLSVFECWMISEHTIRNNFPGGLLSYMFGLMYASTHVVAVATGFVGEMVVDSVTFRPLFEGSPIYVGGCLGPFDLSIICLFLGMIWIWVQWGENYGQLSAEGSRSSEGSSEGFRETVLEAGKVLLSDPRVSALGVVVCCFEGAISAFVLNWTPALESRKFPPPHGLVFAAFMMACMCGASATTAATDAVRPIIIMALICVLSSLAFNVSAWLSGNEKCLMEVFVCFLVFEFCAGAYWPASGMVKSEVVPEHVRGTIYNMYRVPLNAVVMVLLLTDMSMARCFQLCSALLILSCFCIVFIANSKREKVTSFFKAERKANV
eukprot:TRINITY_DN62001_c0_g1_i1.p1 TRINITY_DN62001_c0_g1~~TRINITY_DN62001_c0_g1_i1.p1  ORF type:complete len:501 (-),score=35.48 TRINITY_DN62001_c0_g1_i1:180-1682(-)